MKKPSEVFKNIRFAKGEKRDKPHLSTDDEEHGAVGEVEWNQQLDHQKKRAMQEEIKDKYDEGEYDREGDMAKSDLRSIIDNAKKLHDMIDDADNLPEWVQSKITKAEDYISTVANYMTAEVNEEVEQIDEISKKTLGSYISKAASSLSQASASSSHKRTKASVDYDDNIRRGMKKKDADAHLNRGYDSAKPDIQKVSNRVQGIKKAASRLSKEEVEILDEKNAPTNPSLWSRAKALARSKFDVYPSAYANGWASKWYKSKGGGWKTVSEEKDMKSARIIKDLYKKKGVSDQDKWKAEYKKARAAGSSSSNAKARANGAVYEETLDEGMMKRIATDREEDARLAKSKSWKKETPWMKSKDVVTDKSGAKHGPMSRARDLARKAAIVKEAADKAKAKKKEKKVSDDTYQAEPELSSQIIRND